MDQIQETSISLRLEPAQSQGMYKHNKTGNTYILLLNNVIECTNGREDIRYCLYARDGKVFCRTWEEFNQKFTKV